MATSKRSLSGFRIHWEPKSLGGSIGPMLSNAALMESKFYKSKMDVFLYAKERQVRRERLARHLKTLENKNHRTQHVKLENPSETPNPKGRQPKTGLRIRYFAHRLRLLRSSSKTSEGSDRGGKRSKTGSKETEHDRTHV